MFRYNLRTHAMYVVSFTIVIALVTVSTRPVFADGASQVDDIVVSNGDVFVSFYGSQNGASWGIYRSLDGNNLGGGGNSDKPYGGPARVDAMTALGNGVLTAFYNPKGQKSWGIYRSPDGRNLGGGGNTYMVYNGPARVDAMTVSSNGLLTAFYNPKGGASWGIYRSPDGNNLGGGGNTSQLYSGPARVDAMAAYKNGVLTAFRNPKGQAAWGIYYSPDGNNLGGGGNTYKVYDGSGRVDDMIPYGNEVLTAFHNPKGGASWGIYRSPDGNNLGGGGNTYMVYSGSERVTKMTAYRNGVLTAFKDGKIYFSPDGRNLGGGGSTVLAYESDPPISPSNLRATAVAQSRVSIAWQDNASNEVGYRIYWNRPWCWGCDRTTTVNTPNLKSFTITGMTANRKYCIKVRAFNQFGDSAASNEICVTTSPSASQPRPKTTTVSLAAILPHSGFIPYVGRFPLAGNTEGILQKIENPKTASYILAFVKLGKSSTDCGNPDAVILLKPGESLNSSDLASIYGTTTPVLPVNLVACVAASKAPSSVWINITYIQKS